MPDNKSMAYKCILYVFGEYSTKIALKYCKNWIDDFPNDISAYKYKTELLVKTKDYANALIFS